MTITDKLSWLLFATTFDDFHDDTQLPPYVFLIRSFMIQGGDFTTRSEAGGESICGEKFEDEGVTVKHTKAFLLSMVSSNHSYCCSAALTLAVLSIPS